MYRLMDRWMDGWIDGEGNAKAQLNDFPLQ
jgi:hypothetical protein